MAVSNDANLQNLGGIGVWVSAPFLIKSGQIRHFWNTIQYRNNTLLVNRKIMLKI